MQEASKALEKKLAKNAKRKREELAERVENAETRQRDVQMRYAVIKNEMTHRSVEAIKSYRQEVEDRKSAERQSQVNNEMKKHEAFMTYLTERKQK